MDQQRNRKKHVEESGHQIDWDKTTCLEKEIRLYRRKILENIHIKENTRICINLNEGLEIKHAVRRGERTWLRRGNQLI